MSDRRAVTIGLVPAAAAGMGRAQKRRRPIAITRMLGYGLAVAGLAMAQPAQALITLTASDAGGPIGACSSTDGGTGSLNKNCANPNFTAIIVNAVGAPLVPAPNLVATQLSVTSAALATSDTLTIDVAQTGISFPAGVASVNLTVASLGPSPVTLTALGSGGGVLFSHTFTAVGTATSGDIPVGPGTGEGARFVLAFSGPGQSVNAIISIGGPIPATTSRRDPGSVIVYPKFVNELFDGGSPLVVDGVQVPQTEIEIGAICPPAFVDAGGFCPEHQPLKLRFHWVCPGAEGTNSNICPEVDFDVNLTVPGKLTFAANGLPINTNSPPLVPAPPCARGYLIGWVIVRPMICRSSSTGWSATPSSAIQILSPAPMRGRAPGCRRIPRSPSRPTRHWPIWRRLPINPGRCCLTARSAITPRSPGCKSAMSGLTRRHRGPRCPTCSAGPTSIF